KNYLVGGGGIDRMQAFAGDDAYHVDNALDVVLESAGQGTDNVNAAVSYTLAAGVSAETLRTVDLAATPAIDLTSNQLANIVIGNAGINAINGGAGNDQLNGMAGHDTLTGGAGNDAFLFTSALNAATNVDTITDFNVVQDTIVLDNAVFTALGVGPLAAGGYN